MMAGYGIKSANGRKIKKRKPWQKQTNKEKTPVAIEGCGRSENPLGKKKYSWAEDGECPFMLFWKYKKTWRSLSRGLSSKEMLICRKSWENKVWGQVENLKWEKKKVSSWRSGERQYGRLTHELLGKAPNDLDGL